MHEGCKGRVKDGPRSANPLDISDDEDIDIDAALLTMSEIEAEKSMECEDYD